VANHMSDHDAGLVLAAAFYWAGSEAGERVVVGVTGTPNALAWHSTSRWKRGFFTAQDINIDRIFAPSSAAMMPASLPPERSDITGKRLRRYDPRHRKGRSYLDRRILVQDATL